jgi:hypothetical protein
MWLFQKKRRARTGKTDSERDQDRLPLWRREDLSVD